MLSSALSAGTLIGYALAVTITFLLPLPFSKWAASESRSQRVNGEVFKAIAFIIVIVGAMCLTLSICLDSGMMPERNISRSFLGIAILGLTVTAFVASLVTVVFRLREE